MANHAREITISAADWATLERLVHASATPAGLSRRVRALLFMCASESSDYPQQPAQTLLRFRNPRWWQRRATSQARPNRSSKNVLRSDHRNYGCFLRTKMDYPVIDDLVLRRKRTPTG